MGKYCAAGQAIDGNTAHARCMLDISFFMSVRTSVCPHGTTRLPQDGFSLNLAFGDFSKI